MPLNSTQRKTLRRLGHDLKPIVLLGPDGLSRGALAELERALVSHELVKVRVRGHEREARATSITQMCVSTGAELVQRIGHVALLYRRHPEHPRISLEATPPEA